jgi:cytosine/adenosine deaminase-related metal-dependent hydrolase
VVVDSAGAALATGGWDEVAASHPALPVEEGPGVLMPGLVDCHAHLELAAMAGMVPGGSGIGAWVRLLVQTRAELDPAIFPPAALAAARRMRSLGTVAVGDVCTELPTAPILREAGLAGVSLLEVVGASDEDAAAGFAHAQARLRAYPPAGDVDAAIVPHSPYGTTQEMIRKLSPNRSVHAAEHEDEERWLLEGTGPFAPFLASKAATPPGIRSLPLLESLGAIGPGTLLVHVVTATEEELARAAAAGATAVLCPRSNLHIGGAPPNLEVVRRAGIPWTLGTDSLASTPDHDLLGEVRVLAETFPQVPLDELLRAATVEGARALGLATHPWVRIPLERFPQEMFS